MSIIQDSYYKKYRYSLRGGLGVLYISEPIGWNEDDKVFKRSAEVHGVFMNLSNDLEFYIGDEENDGGYNYLKETYKIYGINAKVILVKEEDVSGTWYEVYRGNFDFSTYVKKPYTISIKFNESGLYEKIKARSSEGLEVDRLTTMEGSILEPLKKEVVALDGRKILIIDELKLTSYKEPLTVLPPGGGLSIEIKKEEVIITMSVPSFMNKSGCIIPLTAIAEQAGNVQSIYDYLLNMNFSGPRDDFYENASSTAIMFYDEAVNPKTIKLAVDIEFKIPYYTFTADVYIDLVKYGGVDALEFISRRTLKQVISNDENATYTYKNDSLEEPLLAGQSLALVVAVQQTNNSGTLKVSFKKASLIVYDETYSDASQSDFILPFEALDRIINIITDEPARLKSNALGRVDSPIVYPSDGYASLTGLTNGFWVREFNTEKITTSFQDFIDSFKAVWQIGYGIEKNGFDEIVRVEHMSHFYQEVVTVRLKGQPNKITRKCAKEYFYSGIEIGYSQPSGTILYEEALGLDEYNILNNYTTAITRIQNRFNSVSKYRADSYGTEFARRKPKRTNPEEDTRYDLNVMILDLKRGLSSIFQQRKWADDFVVPTPFDKYTTGVYSPDTATNLRFSPINTLLRWGFWIKGGFMKNLTEYVRYSSSNGNSSLVTEIDEVGGVPRAENGNVLNSELDKNLFNPDIITFDFPVTNEILSTLNGKTLFKGEEIMNYYGLIEFVNEDGDYEYGFLMSVEPNGEGKWELLSSTKRISSVSTNTGLTSVMTPPTNLTLQDNTASLGAVKTFTNVFNNKFGKNTNAYTKTFNNKFNNKFK